MCFITLLSNAQDSTNAIRGEQRIKGSEEIDGLKFYYSGTIKYRLVLFGGVKFDVNIKEFKISSIKYEGEYVPTSVFKSLNLNETRIGGPVTVKRGLYDIKTDVEFRNCFSFDLRSSNGGCALTVKDVDVLAIGWGSLDEYTYLDDEKLKQLKTFFNITKSEDFYDLDAALKNTKITKLNIDVLNDIKNEMEKLKSKEEQIAQKLKKLKNLKRSDLLSLRELQYKKQLLEELVALDVKTCLWDKTCVENIKDVEDDMMLKRNGQKLNELKKLKANKYLSLEKLKYKKQLLEELITLDVKKCVANQTCEVGIKEVEEEIEKRFGVKGMSEEETIVFIKEIIIKYFKQENLNRGNVLEDLIVSPCQITYKNIKRADDGTFIDKNLIRLKNHKSIEDGLHYLDLKFFKSKVVYTAKGRVIDHMSDDNTVVVFYFTSKIGTSKDKIIDAFKHLESFCKE